MARSRVIVDIEHIQQSGLTMRTFEAIGARKKLATTNTHIANYDFFSPDNICIMNRDAPIIPPDFICSPHDNSNDDLVEKYSLTHWIEKVILG